MTTDQEKTELLVKQYLDMLNKKGEEILRLRGNNSAYNSIWSNYLTTISKCMDKAEDRKEEIRSGAVWDNLVVAFFGETNAGKSTIIETFRILFNEEERAQGLKLHPEGVDGVIVGKGGSDFTQVYKEYKMQISGQPFTLIDVPGIEGNEAKYEEEIREALNKAHYVFYVQGENKKPDTGTAGKIKAYLRDWVKVYSIYNVRGVASNYDEEEEREILLTESERKTETLIIDTFKELLGSTYMGNISLQAYLALCAKARFSSTRDDLQRGQKKIVSYFGNRDSVYQFSQFQSLVEEVSQKSVDFKREIVEANKEKNKAFLLSIQEELNSESKRQRDSIQTLENHINEFKKNVRKDFNSCKENIVKIAVSLYDNIFNQLTEKGIYALKNDVGDKKEYFKKQLDIIRTDFEKYLTQRIQSEISDLNNNIEKRKKHLDQEINQTTIKGWNNINIDFEFEKAIDKLDITFGDIAMFVANVGFGIWGAIAAAAASANIWNPVGWILLVVSVITAFWGMRDREEEAISKMQEEINKAKKDNKPKYSSNIAKFNDKLTANCSAIICAVDKDFKNLKELRNNIQSIMDYLEKEIIRLKQLGYGTI